MAFKYDDYAESDAVKKKREEAEKYKTYVASQSVNDAKTALNTHEQNKVADWTGGTYGESLKEALNRYNNREKFSYDLNGDALYQQYKDMYINQGRMAMQDTMGQAAAMTGGYGNSYAATAGNQAYQSSLQQLNNIVPELYSLALSKYNMEGQDLKTQYDMLNQQYNTEYGQHRDKVSDWNTEAGRLSDKYYNESNLDYSRYADNRDYHTNEYNTERSYDYGLYSDAYNRAFGNYQQGVSEQQAKDQLAIQQAQLKLQQDAAAAKASPFFPEEYEEDLLRGYIDGGEYSDAASYIAWLETKGLPEAAADILWARIPEEYWPGDPAGTAVANAGLRAAKKIFDTMN